MAVDWRTLRCRASISANNLQDVGARMGAVTSDHELSDTLSFEAA